MLRDSRILDDTLAANERRALEELVKGARLNFSDRLVRLVLFGSRARGDQDVDSDIDVLAIVVAGSARTARSGLRQLAAETNLTHDTHLAVLVLDEEEWAELHRRERRLPVDVERDGIEL